MSNRKDGWVGEALERLPLKWQHCALIPLNHVWLSPCMDISEPRTRILKLRLPAGRQGNPLVLSVPGPRKPIFSHLLLSPLHQREAVINDEVQAVNSSGVIRG